MFFPAGINLLKAIANNVKHRINVLTDYTKEAFSSWGGNGKNTIFKELVSHRNTEIAKYILKQMFIHGWAFVFLLHFRMFRAHSYWTTCLISLMHKA